VLFFSSVVLLPADWTALPRRGMVLRRFPIRPPMTTDLLSLNPFWRLARLLQPLTPGRSPLPDGRPVSLAVGDPRTTMPARALEAMAGAAPEWSRYGTARGHPETLAAMVAWLQRRYGLPEGLIDPARHLIPVSGSREGLFFAALAAVARKRAALGGETPLVLLPDPGYHVYGGATAAAGADPYPVRVDAQSGHLPRYETLPDTVLRRAALGFLCSPANPQGAVASAEALGAALAALRRHGGALAIDECYSELYTAAPPAGGLQAAAASGSLEGLLVFHSLSKRSGAPGLRLGFVAGDPVLVQAVEGFLRFGGAGYPGPVLAAGAALWQDEAHVEANRAYYAANMALAERILRPGFGWRRPAGGFFLWLDVSAGRFADGESAARALYQEAGISVLPGSYLSPGGAAAAEPPGRRYIRASLAEPPALLEPLLTRSAEILL